MTDNLSKRMKEQYEFRTRSYLPRRTYTIIRLDGKSFHTYTRKCERPHDQKLARAMNLTTLDLVKQIQGCVFGYTQSDEISLLLTDFDKNETDAWFDGQVQKIVSVSASIATAYFNIERDRQVGLGQIPPEQHTGIPLFDSRVFTIPDRVEVMNYFIWRQKDATRNSLSMLAQAYFSQNQLNGKSQSDLHDMLHDIGVNWNDCSDLQKRGWMFNRAAEFGGPPTIWTQTNELQELVPNYPHLQEVSNGQ